MQITAGGEFDLADAQVVWEYDPQQSADPQAAIRTMLRNGVISGGAAGLFSSTASAAGMGLGYEHIASIMETDPVTGLPDETRRVLIATVFFGDANMDGVVDVGDLGILASNWQENGFWVNADFNYDGIINVSDLGLLASNWQAGVATPTMTFAQALAQFPEFSVPEPGALAWMGLLVGLAGRQRRRV